MCQKVVSVPMPVHVVETGTLLQVSAQDGMAGFECFDAHVRDLECLVV